MFADRMRVMYMYLKTRILSTHSLQILDQVDTIVVLKNGTISEIGNYDELLSRNGSFAEYLRNYLLEEEVFDSTDSEGRLVKFIICTHHLYVCQPCERVARTYSV